MGRSCYTCQGGWLGQATGGFCSKSDRLTSPSPLHEADIQLVCVWRERDSLRVSDMTVRECTVCACRNVSGATGMRLCMHSVCVCG